MEEPISVFLSYSRRDQEMLNRLDNHLSSLKNTGKIKTWHGRDIEAGKEWEVEIQAQLDQAQIILLLISADFLASDYCYSQELQRAIARHDAGEARVVPVILKPCLWKLREIPFSKLAVLPDPDCPITRWDEPEEAYAVIAQHIAEIVKTLQSRPSQPPAEPTRSILLAPPSHLLQLEATVLQVEPKQSPTSLPIAFQPTPLLQIRSEEHDLVSHQPHVDVLDCEDVDLLASDVGVDYSILRDYLRAGKWREADRETARRMQEVAECLQSWRPDESVDWSDEEPLSWVSDEDMRLGWVPDEYMVAFPCTDLHTIDRLWVNYSQGQFGFSVQARLYLECGGQLDGNFPGEDIWQKFCHRVGWLRNDGRWLLYYDRIFSLKAPCGHLPTRFSVTPRLAVAVIGLFFRLENCNF